MADYTLTIVFDAGSDQHAEDIASRFMEFVEHENVLVARSSLEKIIPATKKKLWDPVPNVPTLTEHRNRPVLKED
jgi:hypothetical protein